MPEHRQGLPAPNKGLELPSESYTPDEMRRLLAACSRRGSCGIRDAAEIVVMWRLLLRVNEMLLAVPSDVDLQGLTFHVRHPKRDRKGRSWPRRVPMEPETAAVIERWLRRRAELGISSRAPLFCVIDKRTRGAKQHASVVRERLKALGEKAGIDKRLHPHGLRTTGACDLHFREGAPIKVVQAYMGHRSLSSTDIYLRRYGDTAAQAFARTRRWPADDEPAIEPDAAAALGDALRAHGLTPDLVAAMASALASADAAGGPRGRAA